MIHAAFSRQVNGKKFSLFLACLIGFHAAFSWAEEKSAEPGLIATYVDANHRIVTVVATPNFVLGDRESLHPQLGSNFTAEWNGLLKIVKRTSYTFSFDGAADAKIAIDGQAVSAKPVELDLGDHPIQIKLVRRPGAVRGQLQWSADFFAVEPVPPSALVHRDAPPEIGLQSRIESGQLLVERLNCTACHQTKSTTLTSRQGPELATVGTRLHPAWIAKWLAAPRSFRADTAMPHAPLKADECRDIAAYLATLKNPNNKIKEPQPSTSHVETGKQLVETIGCTACHGGTKGHALDGLGSKWLPGQLAEYLLNPKAVDHSGRMPSMLLQREEAQAIAEFLVQSKKAEFEVNPGDGNVKRGEGLFRGLGCVNCHEMAKSRAVEGQFSTSFERLTGAEKGCVSEHPGGRAMDYGLSAVQRESIASFIDSVRQHPMVSVAPVYEFQHRTQTFGCINCHELNASMPADSTERVPQLTNVGGRLRKEWIGEVLTQKRRVRPWLRRRMPEFDAGQMTNMSVFAEAASGVGEAESVPNPSRDEIAAGQKLLGNGAGGFGCITCHGFAGAKPNVIDDTRGPDITTVANRLRPDHFRRWVLDPKRVSPLTPMPSFFDGMPVADAHAKVETMYRYVSMGENMPPPVGWVDKNNYQLAVHDEPVIMRAFLPNPSGPQIPRGIAVGLPGLVNYCFDADTCTIRYAWTGGFIDMQPSWAGRGGNVVKVLGKRFFENNFFAFRVGDDKHEPERKFEGYEIVNHIPVFTYTIDGIRIRETIAFPMGMPDRGQATFKSPAAPALVDTVEIDESAKPIFLVSPPDRDTPYGRDLVAETLPRGQSVNLGLKPGKIIFMIPLKESK